MRTISFLAFLGLWACGPAPAPPSCGPADTSCPADLPFSGAPCEGMLACDYTTPSGPAHFDCVMGRWDGSVLCAGCAPPLVEVCGTPFAGSDPRAVQVGPATGSFRAFDPMERVPVVWGAQGLAMIDYRVRVAGTDAPACVRVDAALSMDGGTPGLSMRSIVMRCGETLRILQILPGNPCLLRDYPVHLDLTVEGIGTTSADLVLSGGMCPR